MIAIFVFVGLVALILWMAAGVQGPRTFDGPVVALDVQAPVDVSTSTLTVVVWNVAWGYGRGSEGRGGPKPLEHFEATLERMATTLSEAHADVVLLQEVDFDATRSHHRNQARILARKAGFGFVAEAESWKANWVPFPYWPPTAHFGQLSSGGAVLSRFPIEHNEVTLLEKPDDNPFWYNLFYLFRFHQEVGIRWHGAPITVFNAHLDAFSRRNREQQARVLAAALAEADRPILMGGDLNTIPPEAPVQSGFADEPGTDFEGDTTLAVLRGVDDLNDAFSPETFLEAPEKYATFPSEAPNRKLDHMLYSREFEVVEARVLTEAGDASDHLPLLIRFRPARPRAVD